MTTTTRDARAWEAVEEAHAAEVQERDECEACGYWRPIHGAFLRMAPPFETVPICSFCAAVSDWVTVPEVPALDSDYELMGAWSQFSGQVMQFECNLAPKYRVAMIKFEESLPEALQRWIVGSDYDWSVQGEAVAAMWQVQAFGRTLKALEPAQAYTERYQQHWAPQTIRTVIARPEVAHVWNLWLAASAAYGKKRDGDNVTGWHRWGVKHEDDCVSFEDDER
jgi:hypothetical protein